MAKYLIKRISYSSYFARALNKLTSQIQQKFLEKEKVFLNNPFDERLKTHKLHGKYKNFWSFSISGSCRAIFRFANNEEVVFIDVGDHDIYK